ncbi:hypothetical protein FPQ18DRAFT_302056 [Pyronema domesticum]|nr:hypothetical protein FPQ18DRAFT_302056 [Pyronema domesticum]
MDIQIYDWKVSGGWSDKLKEICKDNVTLNPCFNIITIAEPGECAHAINSCIIPNHSLFYFFYSFSPGRQDGGILVNFINNKTTDPMNALDGDIDNYNQGFPGPEVAIIGDLNAHCPAALDRGLADTRIDTRGRALLDLAKNRNLRILNVTAPCNSGPTPIRTKVLSIIDDAITSITMEERDHSRLLPPIRACTYTNNNENRTRGTHDTTYSTTTTT